MDRKKSYTTPKKWGVYVIGILLLIIYFFSLPPVFNTPKVACQYVLFWLALHFLVAFLPYFPQGNANGFWQYNKTLFLSFVTAFSFSAILFLGILFAFFCLDNLLEVRIPDELLQYTFLFLALIFNTWFFLVNIPKRIADFDKDTSYPLSLKVLAQYILLPLMVVYVAILYLYVAKIGLEWSWPKGILSYLILGISVLGILALLLLHPVTLNNKNSWVSKVARAYYILLIPLSILLNLAIWRRVSEYGITENRYFLVALAIWLTLTSLYFGLSKQRNIKFLPFQKIV